ncbi:MAG: glycosyltransferase family 4 protein [Candidatus Pacebacteria bacterium]|nr:glycosyltransferase family 4 protein [Candidatus Paceibacterota bacterium]
MIAYVVPYLDQYGGIQSFARSVGRALSGKEAIRFVDWSFWFPGKIAEKLFNFYPSLAEFCLGSRICRRKRKILMSADLVHFWQPLTAIGFEGSGFLVSCHGKEILPANLGLYQRRLLNRVFQRAGLIQTNSLRVKKLLRQFFPAVPAGKIVVIRPGVHLPVLASKKKDKRLVIGTLARNESRKNLPQILKALEILFRRKVKFLFLLAGGIGVSEKAGKWLKKAPFPYQNWGEISEKRKSIFFSRLDVFVLPVLSLADNIEGFGIVYLEANSYGVPVVASRVDGVVEAVSDGESGVFVDPNEPESIAEGILRLNRQREKFSRQARTWAEKFSLEKKAGEFRNLYRNLMTGTLSGEEVMANG